MESIKRAARRAVDLLDQQEVTGWKLAKLSSERMIRGQKGVKRQKEEGRVTAEDWAAAVSEQWGRRWSTTSARQYARIWWRYGENRLVDEDGNERPFVEHQWAAEVSEANAEANIERHLQHNEDRPLSEVFGGAAAEAARTGPDAEPTPSQVVDAVRKNPDVARAIARHDDTREAVEEAANTVRATRRPPRRSQADLDDEDRDNRAAASRRMEMDQAVVELRAAATALAEAIVFKEKYGVEFTDEEQEALDRIDRYRAAYAADRHLTTEDHDWLAEQGISL